MPFSVRDGARTGSETGAELSSAWSGLLAALQRAAAVVESDRVPQNPVDTAAGYRHLLVLLHIAIEEVVRNGKALAITAANTDNDIKWGMDCPDCAYSGCGIRGDETYVITGNKGSARYVSLQANAGMATTANVLLDEIDCAANGDFSITLSVDQPATGSWLPIAPDASVLIIRQFLYDWDTEELATMRITRTSPASPGRAHVDGDQLSPDAAIARQLTAAGAFVEGNLEFFLAFANPEHPNAFNPPFDGTAMGAAAENRPVIGAWKLAPDEALLIEVTPPVGLYWSLSIGNVWWETIDYAEHITSLNGHQTVIDDDGVARWVVAHEDPGTANWLDTAGHSEGPMILRCVRTETAPQPTTRVLKLTEVLDALPASHPRVTAEERAATIDARRIAVARRFS